MSATGHLPIIGISVGDPAGIGPEITARALVRPEVKCICRPLVVSDAGVYLRAAHWVGNYSRVNSIRSVPDARWDSGVTNVFDLANVDLETFRIGEVSAAGGKAAFEAVTKVIDLAMNTEIDATVTAPIHKESLSKAGFPFPGHTEIFAKYTGTDRYTMMLAAGETRVVHVSTHVSLRKACDAVTKDRVLAVIKLAHDACRTLGIDRPTVGVAGLNPHASDGGLFGDEEEQDIIPAVKAAREMGIDAIGPQPPDTFFAKVTGGAYDIAVAMYHDQGHIPVKAKGFKYDAKSKAWTSVRGINVSLGLPIIRTSVDHGTAFDQAGKGTASEESMIDAIEYAVKLANAKAKQRKVPANV